MKIHAFNRLACPLCEQPLSAEENPLRCANGHSFDMARQGYVNLLPVQQKKSKSPGDSKEMVIARQRFLDTGVYQPIAALLARNIQGCMADSNSISLLDAGCGEGYYLNFLASQLASRSQGEAALLGLDISKPAVISAAKRSKEIRWLVASNKQLPVMPASLDMIVSMFGFPVYDAFKAALKPGGKIVLVEASVDHLIELRRIIYPQVRERGLPSLEKAAQLGYELTHTESLRIEDVHLDKQQLDDLLIMTPHLYRASKSGKDAVKKLNELSITIDLVLRVLQG